VPDNPAAVPDNPAAAAAVPDNPGKNLKNRNLCWAGGGHLVARGSPGPVGTAEDPKDEPSQDEGEQGGRGRVLEGVAAATEPERPRVPR